MIKNGEWKSWALGVLLAGILFLAGTATGGITGVDRDLKEGLRLNADRILQNREDIIVIREEYRHIRKELDSISESVEEITKLLKENGR